MLPGQDLLLQQLQNYVELGHSVLLIGSNGIGKSHILEYLLSIHPEATHIEAVMLAINNVVGESELILEKKMKDGKMWLIDDIELLAGKDIDFRDPLKFSIKCYFLRKFYPSGFCIATCSDVKNLDDFILSKFQHQIRIVVSQKEQRLAIAKNILKRYPSDLPFQDLFLSLVESKFGATPQDFEKVLQEMTALHIEESKYDEAFVKECFNFRPQALLPYLSDVPRYELDSLHGIESQKEVLKASLIDPFTHYELYRKHGLSVPKGVIIYGATGCGKTHLGIAMVRHSGLNLLVIDTTSLRSKYIGETEKRLQNIFQSARECAPCVLFFDRLECLMGERTVESGGAARIVSCFLTELDGIGTKDRQEDGMVIVMGTVERLDQLDPAITRPGRLGVHVHMGPLTEQGKISLYKEYETKDYKLTESELENIINSTASWSGAKFRHLFQDAAYHAIRLKKETVTFSDFKI